MVLDLQFPFLNLLSFQLAWFSCFRSAIGIHIRTYGNPNRGWPYEPSKNWWARCPCRLNRRRRDFLWYLHDGNSLCPYVGTVSRAGKCSGTDQFQLLGYTLRPGAQHFPLVSGMCYWILLSRIVINFLASQCPPLTATFRKRVPVTFNISAFCVESFSEGIPDVGQRIPFLRSESESCMSLFTLLEGYHETNRNGSSYVSLFICLYLANYQSHYDKHVRRGIVKVVW